MKNSKIVQVMMMGLMLMGTMGQAQALGCLFKAKSVIVEPIIKQSVVRRAGIAVLNGMKRHKLATAFGAAAVIGLTVDQLYAGRVTRANGRKFDQYTRQTESVLAHEAAVKKLEDQHKALLHAAQKLDNAKELVNRSSYYIASDEVAAELDGLERALSGLLDRSKHYYGDNAHLIFATHEKAKAEKAHAENIANSTQTVSDHQRAESATEIVRQFERIEKKRAELKAAHGKLEADLKQAQDEYNALLGSDASIAAVVDKINAAKVDLKNAQDELAKVASHAALKDKKQTTLLRRAWDYVRQTIVRALSK
jgi:hypothetical protein